MSVNGGIDRRAATCAGAGCDDPGRRTCSDNGSSRPPKRSKTCVVTLKDDAAAQGYKLELEPACKTGNCLSPKDIVAWSVRDSTSLRLQDATGESVIDLTEVEAGIFEGLRQARASTSCKTSPPPVRWPSRWTR